MGTAHAIDEVAKLSSKILGGKLGERRRTERSIPLACSAVTDRALPLPDRRTGLAG